MRTMKICENCNSKKGLVKADKDNNYLCKNCFKEFKKSGVGYIY